jgi:hypothetical protein
MKMRVYILQDDHKTPDPKLHLNYANPKDWTPTAT